MEQKGNRQHTCPSTPVRACASAPAALVPPPPSPPRSRPRTQQAADTSARDEVSHILSSSSITFSWTARGPSPTQPGSFLSPVSTPLPSTSSGIIRGTSPIQAGAARAVLGPQTPVQEAPGTLQPSLEASASGPTQEDLAPRPHEPAEGESDPTRAHAAPKPP